MATHFTDMKLKVASYNCKNVKSSIAEIKELCIQCDIVFLQETWLLKCELGVLSGISDVFYGNGTSAINDESGVLHGRPHGGIGVLWNKKLQNCKAVLCDERIMLFELKCGQQKILFVNVYMPFCCYDNLPDYMYYLIRLLVLLVMLILNISLSLVI